MGSFARAVWTTFAVWFGLMAVMRWTKPGLEWVAVGACLFYTFVVVAFPGAGKTHNRTATPSVPLEHSEPLTTEEPR